MTSNAAEIENLSKTFISVIREAIINPTRKNDIALFHYSSKSPRFVFQDK
ncbi:MAG: hypothetical protein ACFFE6_03650 [Candidatus Thorarchaeota archaeon]